MAKYIKVDTTHRIYCHMYVVYRGYHLTNQTVGLASVSIYAQDSFEAERSKAFFTPVTARFYLYGKALPIL